VLAGNPKVASYSQHLLLACTMEQYECVCSFSKLHMKATISAPVAHVYVYQDLCTLLCIGVQFGMHCGHLEEAVSEDAPVKQLQRRLKAEHWHSV
jgi:hypothetical protein